MVDDLARLDGMELVVRETVEGRITWIGIKLTTPPGGDDGNHCTGQNLLTNWIQC